MAENKSPPGPLQAVVDAKVQRSGGRVKFSLHDIDEEGKLRKSKEEENPLAGTKLQKSFVNYTEDVKRGKEVNRLSFEVDPTHANYYQSLWMPKWGQLPDHVLKQVSLKDSLVASILTMRSSQMSAFGRELQDRFASGYRIEPRPGVMEDASNEQKELLQKRIEDASKLISTCGSIEGVRFDERMSLSTFLSLQTRNALVFGRFATEIIYTRDPDGTRKFHSYRPVDAGTIYQAAPRQDHLNQVRKEALHLLQQLKGPDAEKLSAEKFENDEYAWVQVLDGKPRQAYTPEEMVVHNMFPLTDIELRGYPISPIETVIDGIATHMNIVQHNKLYFQSGRAARGMVVIKSPDVDQGLVAQIRQHFNASINSVSNAWRVPVFGVDPEDSVEWAPFDMSSGRDMEFQYLSDQNAREICSAFLISPEELPGYQHLSRGTNSQALSESSNEYKLEAARDVGIRPLLNHFQDFLNDHILPLIDPAVAQLCSLKLYGLDADTEEKEDTGLTNRMQIDLTMDEILERKEKDPVGKEWGGKFLFNPAWQSVLDKYFKVSDIKKHFFGLQPTEDDEYVRDPFWFNYQQLKMQAEQMEQQAQAQQQQAQAESGGEVQDESQEQDSQLAQSADKAIDLMSKSEKQLPPGKRRLLHLHKKIVKDAMAEWEKDSKEALAAVVQAVKDE